MAGQPDKIDTVKLYRDAGEIIPSRVADYGRRITWMGKRWTVASDDEEEHF